MEGDMLDYVAMTMKDLDQEALSSDSIRENASSKPSRYRARHAAAVRGGYESIATKPAARRARKGVETITLKMISEKISAGLRNRQAMHEWSQFSDLRLCPIRSRRSDIEDVVRRLGPRRANT
jgi:hypothetical protein